jgi:hypothetical protein
MAFEFGCKLSRINAFIFVNCRSLSSNCVVASVDRLCDYCFSTSLSFRGVNFERDSSLLCIEKSVFGQCTSLSSIWIPSSVQSICQEWFSWCLFLSSVTFECDSELYHIGRRAFFRSNSFSSLEFPIAFGQLDSFGLLDSGLGSIWVAENNLFFRLCGDFVLDLGCECVLEYLVCG